jgi:hypothetical protein
MSVVEAVQGEIDRLGEGARVSAVAATALALAREMDDVVSEEACAECGHRQEWTVGHNSATSKSLCAKELRASLAELRALNPPKPEEDRVDEIAKRRERRLARATG